jgi:flagella basal body P-ring formation protein FlgA
MRRAVTLCLIVLLGGTAFSSNEAHGFAAGPTSARTISVDGERITLGDLSPTAPRELFSLDVAPAPAPGARTQISRSAVADALRRAGADPDLATALPARQQVRRSSTTIAAETLTEEVYAKLLGVLPLGIEVESVVGMRDVLVPVGASRIDVKVGRLRRSTIATVEVSVGERRWATLRATVQLAGEASTPVLVDDLAPGTTITDAHVQLRKVELDALPEGAVTRSDQLVGKRMRNRARVDAPVRKSSAEELPIIARGAVVTMVATLPGLRVTRKAIAQQEGAKGATIRVKLDDGTSLPVIVHDAGEVHVAGLPKPGGGGR